MLRKIIITGAGLLLLSIIMSLVGCISVSINGKQSTTGTTVTTDITTDKPEEQVDPKAESKAKLKKLVTDLINSDNDYESPSTIISEFMFDYGFEVVNENNDLALSLESISERQGVKTYKYVNGDALYEANRDGVQVVISQKDGVLNVERVASNPGYYPSLLCDFGIDISLLYNEKEVSAPDPEFIPVLTEDMLTVTDDLKNVCFSDEFMRSYAEFFCKSQGYSQKETETFMESYTGSGVYHVPTNTVTLTVGGYDSRLGDITYTAEQKDGELDNGGVLTTILDYKMMLYGMEIPYEVKLTYLGFEYSDGKPVRGLFDLQSGYYIAAADYVSLSEDIEYSDSAQIYLNLDENGHKTLSANRSAYIQTGIYMDALLHYNMRVYEQRDDFCISVMGKNDPMTGDIDMQLEGIFVSYDEDIAEIPGDVMALINETIDNALIEI